MKLKQYLTLGIGIITGFGLSLATLSYASNSGSDNVNLITSEKDAKWPSLQELKQTDLFKNIKGEN